MSTLGPLLRKTERRLANAGIGDARIEADLVWMTALGTTGSRMREALS